MAKKEKKAKVDRSLWTGEDWYRHYRKQYYLLMAGKWACIAVPLVVILGVRWNVYFPPQDYTAMVKASTGVSLLGVVGGVAAYNEARRKNPKTGESSPWAGPIGWGLVALIIYLLGTILNDLAMICGAEFAGQVGACACRMGMTNRAKYMEDYRKANISSKVFHQDDRKKEGKEEDEGNHEPTE